MVRRERVEPIPNVTVQAVVGRNYEFNNLTTAGVQVSIPLPTLLELRKAEVEIGGMLLTDGLSTPATPTSQGHIEAVPTPR